MAQLYYHLIDFIEVELYFKLINGLGGPYGYPRLAYKKLLNGLGCMVEWLYGLYGPYDSHGWVESQD